DVGVEQVEFATHLAGIALAKAGAALAQRLDLAALQDDAGLEGLVDEIVEARAPVLGDRATARLAGAGHATLPRPVRSARHGPSPAAPHPASPRRSRPAAAGRAARRGRAGSRHISPGPGCSPGTARGGAVP